MLGDLSLRAVGSDLSLQLTAIFIQLLRSWLGYLRARKQVEKGQEWNPKIPVCQGSIYQSVTPRRHSACDSSAVSEGNQHTPINERMFSDLPWPKVPQDFSLPRREGKARTDSMDNCAGTFLIYHRESFLKWSNVPGTDDLLLNSHSRTGLFFQEPENFSNSWAKQIFSVEYNNTTDQFMPLHFCAEVDLHLK